MNGDEIVDMVEDFMLSNQIVDTVNEVNNSYFRLRTVDFMIL